MRINASFLSAPRQNCSHAGRGGVGKRCLRVCQWTDLQQLRGRAHVGVTFHYSEPTDQPLGSEPLFDPENFIVGRIGGPPERRVSTVRQNYHPAPFPAALRFCTHFAMMLECDRKRKMLRPDFDDVPEARRRNLAAVKGKNTRPELLVRRSLHGLGYRFRLHDRLLPGRPDIVFPARKAAVEIRGCFWHRHGCTNSVLPRTRAAWWEQKLAKNVARDAANESALRAAGWRLMVVWECDIRRDLPATLGRLCRFLGPPRTSKRT